MEMMYGEILMTVMLIGNNNLADQGMGRTNSKIRTYGI